MSTVHFYCLGVPVVVPLSSLAATVALVADRGAVLSVVRRSKARAAGLALLVATSRGASLRALWAGARWTDYANASPGAAHPAPAQQRPGRPGVGPWVTR
jgi:hypothetical protein